MAEESEKSKGIASVVHAFLSFIPADLRDMVGFFTGFALVVALPISVGLGVITLYYTMQKSKANNVACWQVQVIEGRTFKLNTCTGELSEFKTPPAAAEPSKQKQ